MRHRRLLRPRLFAGSRGNVQCGKVARIAREDATIAKALPIASRDRDNCGRSPVGRRIARCCNRKLLLCCACRRLDSQDHSGRSVEEPMLKEFQEFIAKGNVIDLAVGIIIGAAFTAIVNSVVNDLIMPIFGAIGGVDFSNYFLPLSSNVTAVSLEEARKQGAVFAYGNFITVLINFIILAWIVFMIVRGINELRKRLEKQKAEAPVAPVAPPQDIALLTEIRDILATK
jgi:large conductance mechanosensitive channel